MTFSFYYIIYLLYIQNLSTNKIMQSDVVHTVSPVNYIIYLITGTTFLSGIIQTWANGSDKRIERTLRHSTAIPASTSCMHAYKHLNNSFPQQRIVRSKHRCINITVASGTVRAAVPGGAGGRPLSSSG